MCPKSAENKLKDLHHCAIAALIVASFSSVLRLTEMNVLMCIH